MVYLRRAGLLWLTNAPAWAAMVVVDGGGAVYAQQGDAEPVALVRGYGSVAFTVLSEAGGWMEVTTRATTTPACGALRADDAEADLHLWIKREAAARVLTRRVEVPWPEGGSLLFHAGYRRPDLTGARDEAGWRRTLDAWEAAIPADAWGVRVTPDPAEVTASAWAPVSLEGWDQLVITPSGPVQLPYLSVADAPAAGGQLHVDLQCLSLTARAPGLVAPSPFGGPLAGLAGITAAGTGRVTDGAALRWPDGTPAGTAGGGMKLDGSRAVGDLRCGKLASRWIGPEVCVSAGDLTLPPPPPVPARATFQATRGATAIRGPLTEAELGPMLDRKMAQIRYCYQREVQKIPSLTGDLSVDFRVEPNGAVSHSAAVPGTLRSTAVEACVAQRFYQMTFPEHDAGSQVRVLFSFSTVLTPAAP